MHTYRTLATLTFLLVTLVTCHQPQLPLISKPQQPLLRDATFNDADDIASVVIAAFSPTPAWQYIYQFHESKPKEHYRCVRFGVMQGLSSPKYHIEVIETPEDVKGELSVAAVAAWRPNFTLGTEDKDEMGLGMGMYLERVASKYYSDIPNSRFRTWRRMGLRMIQNNANTEI